MSQFNLPKIEEEVLKFWQKEKIFQKSLAKDSPQGEFVFYEGPPTANGRPGIHHLLARAFKDLIPRYKTMRGFHVVRKAGWDTHGLPVEIEVEKKLGLKNKQEIEAYGIEKFNTECRKSVWTYKEEWERFTERIAFWIDMENPYVTYDNEYIESLWWIIKQWHKDSLFYEGHKVLPHCPRCVTALSSHEVAEGYKTVTEPSVYVKFKVVNGNVHVQAGDFILAWTTTPWTLPGNVALAVGGKLDYVKVKKDNEFYILAKDLIDDVIEGEYEIIGELSGKDLVGLKYEPLFDSLKDAEGLKHEVVLADFVTTEDGTGVVHTAVMYGDDDYKLGMELGLAAQHTVSEDGTFNDKVSQWQGQPVKDVEKEIIKDLEKRNLLLKVVDYEHEYPFCWRCGTSLLYYARHSWFVAVSKLQNDLLKNNEQINWVPEHIKHGRFGEWLKDVKDWAFSRDRFWGTPLPVWKCLKSDCGEVKVIGSFKELEDLSGKRLDDYHRPFIDEVAFKCDKCGGEMRRVSSVCDVWFDSGAMPFAQYHYPHENKELIDSSDQYPADYICEAVDQTRGWFYTLLAISTLLKRGTAYKNCISLGHILDKHGKKMSKSKGNVINPWEMIEKYGADSLRWHFYIMSAPGEPKRFDEQALKESSRIFITLLNVVSFYKMFSQGKIDDLEEKDLTNVLDVWITAKLNELNVAVTERLDKYDITGSARLVQDFVNDLSVWYVRRSRGRFKSDDENVKMPAVRVLRRTLFHLTRIMAPFTPFIADYINKIKLEGIDESVHLTEWWHPEFEELIKKSDVINKMQLVRDIVEMGLAKRDEAKLPVRQPLQQLTVSNSQLTLGEDYIQLIKDELNIKEVEVETKKGELAVKLDTKITEELRLEGMKRDLVRQINNLRKKQGLSIQDTVQIGLQSDTADIKKVLELYKDDILKGTLASEFVDEFSEGEEIKVGGEKIKISLIK